VLFLDILNCLVFQFMRHGIGEKVDLKELTILFLQQLKSIEISDTIFIYNRLNFKSLRNSSKSRKYVNCFVDKNS